jgi:protein SMG6
MFLTYLLFWQARRRYLKSLLGGSDSPAPRRTTRPSRGRRSARDSQALLPIRPGYTVLIVDTNLLLSSLSSFAALVESRRWTIVVPLPVIMELDGLSATKGPLGEAAKSAADYVGEKVKTYSLSLKVQTSRGNYLSGLTVRREDVDFTASSSRVKERNMDDLILRTAMCHQDQWVDRSAMLQSSEVRTLNDVQGEPVKVVLLSLDRNCKSRGFSQ